jgi:hypothetical protein
VPTEFAIAAGPRVRTSLPPARSLRLYTHGAGSYRGLPDREAYLTFVEAIEGIMAEEQNIFWRERGNNRPTPPANSDTKAAGEPRITEHLYG